VFSARLPGDLSPNPLAAALERMRRAGRPFDDLTASNPTDVGLHYPAGLLDSLSSAAALHYEPQPFGLPAAREAVAADYARRGVQVDPSRVALTASSSESYSLLFKLLCDPGDSVLVPTPSYPLFEHLTRLEGVQARSYATEYHGTWTTDLDAVRQAIDETTRAVLVVSPNNPTGAWLKGDELMALTELCARHDLALIGDEVFADYAIDPAPGAQASVISQADVLTFSLGGLSKSIGLPQLKLGWIAVSGPAALTTAALLRLELIADTYLSVGTPVQVAARELLTAGDAVRRQIRERVVGNYETLKGAVPACGGCEVLRAEGGWSAVIRMPHTAAEDEQVLRMLEDHQVLVHPGYFFDFPREGYFVVSLLAAPTVFHRAIGRVFAAVAA
jgi:alanine-synthesizing transaminase